MAQAYCTERRRARVIHHTLLLLVGTTYYVYSVGHHDLATMGPGDPTAIARGGAIKYIRRTAVEAP